MSTYNVDPIQEIAPSLQYTSENVQYPEYGRLLEDFSEGEVFIHPRAFTIDRSFAQEFATVFHDACPLFLSAPYAQANGFRDLAVPPLMVFNIALCLGVQNNSEKAVANLGYYNVLFTQPVYPGDTLTARSKVISRRERGEGKPGIVHVKTLCMNQSSRVVLQYERKIMIAPRGSAVAGGARASHDFPELTDNTIELPDYSGLDTAFVPQTGSGTYFEDFQPGQVIVHKNMRTITNEHYQWAYRLGNTHPLHYDRLYSAGLSGKMSGEPIVYGGLVFGWLAGLASRDTTENMLWDLGYHEGYHTQPAITGDTVGAITRILKTEPGPLPGTGIVQSQLIGVKNITTREAMEKHGADLFIKENDKKNLGKEKIADKIFEIERRLIIKKRPA